MGLLSVTLTAILAAQSAPADAKPAEESTGPSPAVRAYQAQLQADLRNSQSPRERALGARLLYDGPDYAEQAKSQGRDLRAAAKAAPDDALVQYLWAMIHDDADAGCSADDPCPDRRLAAARVEPDNGAAWLLPLRGLKDQRDSAEADELLAKAAAADRFDDHSIEQVRAWEDALKSRPLPAPEIVRERLGSSVGKFEGAGPEVSVRALGFANAFESQINAPFPNFHCRKSELAQLPAARFENCAKIGRKMMRAGNSGMMQGVGYRYVSLAELSTPEDEAVRRTQLWRADRFLDHAEDMQSAEGFAAFYGDLVSTNSGETAQNRLLQRAGVALEPPADWKPSQ
jgi:hypothetical protein